MNRIIRMFISLVVLRFVQRGIDAGIDRAARGSRRDEDMTPEQRAQLRQTQNRGRQMARMARRLTRF